MVLINTVTVEAINTALIALQRGENIVVGGEKGGTVNNINVTNNGTGSGTDVSPQLNALDQRVTEVENENERQNERIAGLEGLGIEDIEFEEGSRTLFIYLVNGDVLDVVIPDRPLSLSLNGTTLTLSSDGETLSNVELPFIPSSEKGVAGGVATLDSSGRIPYSQLPESAMEFKGTWNASTNTPHLTDGTGTNGDFYVCTMPGTTTFGPGNTVSFIQNDRVIYDGATSKWIKLLAGQVSTVNGMSGDVVLNGTNVNYSDAVNSPTLKSKIDAVETKADTQVDWNENNSSSLAYIKNKPTIPSSQVQSDWTQTDSTQKDFIKHKIPIWIVSGTSGSDVTPIDSVTNGSMRPITSNAVRNGGNDILSALPDWTADPTDTTKLIRRDTNGTASFGQVTFLTLWNYIKSKIQSIALTIGSATSTVAETLFGSISIKQRVGSTDVENANITQEGTIGGKGFVKKWTTLDLSSLDSTKWFPVTFNLTTTGFTELECYVSLNSGTKPSWSTHSDGFTCHLHLLAIGGGWDTTNAQTLVLDRQYGWASINPCGWGQMTNSSTGVLWLRGGGKYFVWNNKNATFTIRTSTYTISEQSVSPTTTYQWYIRTSQIFGTLNGNCTGSAGSVSASWLLDKIYPVGSIYMSTTHTSPQTFLGGTWEEFTDGRFLRASGGNAGTVGNIQAEGLPNITGAISNASGTYGVTGFESSAGSFTGAFSGATLSGKSHTGASTDSGSAKVVNFNASNGNSTVPDGQSSGKIYGNSSHVTPKNMAVYMWRRTS